MDSGRRRSVLGYNSSKVFEIPFPTKFVRVLGESAPWFFFQPVEVNSIHTLGGLNIPLGICSRDSFII